MSNKSDEKGRAFEYASITVFEREISKHRSVAIIKNSVFEHAETCWKSLSESEKRDHEKGAIAAVLTVMELEPMILEKDSCVLELEMQSDQKGITGDVRDILIIRRNVEWEIGISIKHNHYAVKHSRLSRTIDFGESWFGVKCSDQYWSEVSSIFDRLKSEKAKGTKWSELTDKATSIYIPLLSAFKSELERLYEKEREKIPKSLVEYLIGKFDFYKAIAEDKLKCTIIQIYNFHGSLNRSSSTSNPKIAVPISSLPSRIALMEMKPGSNNTLELYMDEGWQFSFRIHNASTAVEPSLKFDINMIGAPTVVTLRRQWS